MTDPTVVINDLPALPRDQEGPVFNEPWEAQAFALAVRLSEAGYFTWSEWAVVLSQEIKAAQARGDPDLGQTYYQHWLNALERLCAEKGLVGRDDVHRRTEEWRRAYLNTPHGQPVELEGVAREKEGRDGNRQQNHGAEPDGVSTQSDLQTSGTAAREPGRQDGLSG